MAGIEAELQGERAFALGQAGKRLETALAALANGPVRGPLAANAEELLDEAATATWHYLIVREGLGMFDHEDALALYGVPGRVRARVGIVKKAGA